MKAWIMRLGLVFGMSAGGLCLAGEPESKSDVPLPDMPEIPITVATDGTTNMTHRILHAEMVTVYPRFC